MTRPRTAVSTPPSLVSDHWARCVAVGTDFALDDLQRPTIDAAELRASAWPWNQVAETGFVASAPVARHLGPLTCRASVKKEKETHETGTRIIARLVKYGEVPFGAVTRDSLLYCCTVVRITAT